MKKYVTEFIGTFFLVLTIGLAGPNPLVIGSTLMVMIYAGGHISGAHYNPAVTLAVFIRKRMPASDALFYMASQFLGALVAGLIVSIFIVLPDKAESSTFALGKALLAELLGTFALAYVVLNVATADANAGNSYFGLAIGFTVFAMASILGQFSGGAFNPAVAVGLIVMNLIKLGNGWIYLVACFTGAAMAAFLFVGINPDERAIAGPEDKID